MQLGLLNLQCIVRLNLNRFMLIIYYQESQYFGNMSGQRFTCSLRPYYLPDLPSLLFSGNSRTDSRAVLLCYSEEPNSNNNADHWHVCSLHLRLKSHLPDLLSYGYPATHLLAEQLSSQEVYHSYNTCHLLRFYSMRLYFM